MADSVKSERESLKRLICEAAALAGGDNMTAKKLKKKLKVSYPTAVKLLAALYLNGYAERDAKDRFVFAGRPSDIERIAERASKDNGYLPLYEIDKDFKKVGFDGYIGGMLMPALKIGLTYGSLSVLFLQRKMAVVSERAKEIYDLLEAAGLIGELEDERNPGRMRVTYDHAAFDAINERVNRA